MLPRRYVFCFLGTAGMMTTSIALHSFFAALDNMVYPIYEYQPSHSEFEQCPFVAGLSNHFSQMNPPPEHAKFYWDSSLVGAIIQSYYIGYLVSLMPAGLLVDLYGARHVWGTGLLVASIMTLLLPSLAHLGPYTLISGLVMVGFGQGVSIPCSGAVIAHWAGTNELCSYTAIIHIGDIIGWLLVFFFSSDISHVFGWQGLLYLGGILQAFCCIIWFSVYRNNPSKDNSYFPVVDSDLPRTVMQSIAIKMIRIGRPPPWKHIFLSRPVLALLLLSFMSGWSLYILSGILKYYFSNVVNISTADAWKMSGVTFTAIVPSALLHAIACDLLVFKGFMSCTVSRRSFSVLPNFLLVPLLLSVTLWDCNTIGVVLTVLTSLYVRGIYIGTLNANPIDLSPRHVGVLTALSQSFFVIGSMVNKELEDYFIPPKSRHLATWNPILWTISGLLIILSIPYLLFGSGDLQHWNELPFVQKVGSEEEDDSDEENM